ncbi:hypothetical protein V1477_003334 [Vespula maculifrons]|uniref:Uncharacterized protein n=1 Tax=Vespula maculifrons TaxID=7453 RepID=A0ABD2CU77_VESMC
MEKLEYKSLFVDVTKANKLIKLLKYIERKMLSLKGNITSMISCIYRYMFDLNVSRFFLDHNSKT